MELKSQFRDNADEMLLGSNRTFMELKLMKKRLTYTPQGVLIVPLWN